MQKFSQPMEENVPRKKLTQRSYQLNIKDKAKSEKKIEEKTTGYHQTWFEEETLWPLKDLQCKCQE